MHIQWFFHLYLNVKISVEGSSQESFTIYFFCHVSLFMKIAINDRLINFIICSYYIIESIL